MAVSTSSIILLFGHVPLIFAIMLVTIRVLTCILTAFEDRILPNNIDKNTMLIFMNIGMFIFKVASFLPIMSIIDSKLRIAQAFSYPENIIGRLILDFATELYLVFNKSHNMTIVLPAIVIPVIATFYIILEMRNKYLVHDNLNTLKIIEAKDVSKNLALNNISDKIVKAKRKVNSNSYMVPQEVSLPKELNKNSDEDEFKHLLLNRKTTKTAKPPIALLEDIVEEPREFKEEHKNMCFLINKVFEDFDIPAFVNKCIIGYSVILFAIEQKKRVKIDALMKLESDISFTLGCNVKITENNEMGIPLSIEIPNTNNPILRVKHVINRIEKKIMASMSFPLGLDLSDNVHTVQLDSLPHLLIAGTTGSGKSVCLHAIITGLLLSTSIAHLDFIMIDPKLLELNFYRDIPHLIMPVINKNNEAYLALKWLNTEMERRYDIMSKLNVRNIKEYNNHSSQMHKLNIMKNIVLVVEEFGDLILDKKHDFNSQLIKLAQKSRASGIYIILTTQRPSANVVTGILKANIPGRIAMQVSSKLESRIIMDVSGAELLRGKGDLFFSKPGHSIIRLQSPYITPEEINKITAYWK